LVREGAALRQVSLVLAEKLEGGFTPALPTIGSDADGLINSGFIVPGRSYFATVIDQATQSTWTGDLTFGSIRDVDIGGLRGGGGK
jgi:hypothetical protein